MVKGTSITVEAILRKLAEGATEDQLLEAYPRLTAKMFAARLAMRLIDL